MPSDDFFKLVRSWLTIHLPRARRLSPHTIRSYKAALTTLLDYLRQVRGLTLSDITFDVIDQATITEFLTWLLERKHLAPSSANQRLAAIKSFLAYCAGEDPGLVAIWINVAQVKPMRAPAPPPEGLAIPALDALIRAPGQTTPLGIRDTTLMLLMFDAAARVQEVLDLTLTDIDTAPGRGTVTLTGKGRKTRTVPIMDNTGRHLDRYLTVFHPQAAEQGTPLFYTVRGGHHSPMSQDNVAYLLRKHAAKARENCPEVPERIHAHQLRHARAMQMLRADVPLPHIKEFLGHANIATTNIYASADNQMVRKAVQQAGSNTPEPAQTWEGDDELILRLSGLK